jgi:4-aminobutyrate aminotransferase-like enzyme
VIDVIEEEQLVARANHLGEKLTNRLKQLQTKVPALKDVRGLGSMIAVEFFDPVTGEPSTEITKRVQQIALEKGLILLTCGVYTNALRFLYPLTIEDDIFEEALTILEQALLTA